MDEFGVDSKDLSDFFNTISIGKQKRKKQLDETVGNAVDDFLNTISIGKKVVKEKKEFIAGDSFETLFLSALQEEKKDHSITDGDLNFVSKKSNIPKKEPKKKTEQEANTVNIFENWSDSDQSKQQEQVIGDTIESQSEQVFGVPNEHKEDLKESNLIEKSLGLLAEPSDVKQQNDPLTPLDQKFATLDDLQKHYKLFLNRIQQQLSTLGGGGETNLAYMDMPLTYVTSSSYTVSLQDYYIGVNYAGAVTITLPTPKKNGKTYIVKDERGEASKGANRHIYIVPSGSDLIDEEDRAILAYDYGSLTFVYRNGWRVV